jgi:hypothetical protein
VKDADAERSSDERRVPRPVSVDDPDRVLNRLTTALRIFTVIPIAIVLASIGAYTARWGGRTSANTIASVAAACCSCRRP